jgi:hypothetical protein
VLYPKVCVLSLIFSILKFQDTPINKRPFYGFIHLESMASSHVYLCALKFLLNTKIHII